MDALFFWFFSFGMIVTGLAVILNRNPVASALCFACSIIFMSGLFVLLSAFFLAAVQILVTAGAVMVLFLFIIMLLNPEVLEHIPRRKIWTACSMIVALGFVFLVARTLQDMPGIGHLTAASLHSRDAEPDFTGTPSDNHFQQDSHDDTHRIGRLLFTRYVAPFEVTSLLILVATIGVIVLCKQEEPFRRPPPEEEIVHEAPPLDPKELEKASTR